MDVITTIGFAPSANLQGSHLAGQASPRLKGHANSTRVKTSCEPCSMVLLSNASVG